MRSVFFTPLVLAVLGLGCAHEEPKRSAPPPGVTSLSASPSSNAPGDSFDPTLHHAGSAPPPVVDPNVEHPAEHGRRIVAPTPPSSPSATPSASRPR